MHRIDRCLSYLFYCLSLFLIIYFSMVSFINTLRVSPIKRVLLLLLISLFMYVGAILFVKHSSLQNSRKLFRFNLWVWFFLYLTFLSTLTLFDSYFKRNSFFSPNWRLPFFENDGNYAFNGVPFSTILSYFDTFCKGKITGMDFMYNIFGNMVAFTPFAFFLPLLFAKQKNFSTFFLTILGIVVTVELLQLVTLSGVCDVDDVILNVLGACLLYLFLSTQCIRYWLNKIFLFE